jgi:hypothetical protein
MVLNFAPLTSEKQWNTSGLQRTLLYGCNEPENGSSYEYSKKIWL